MPRSHPHTEATDKLTTTSLSRRRFVQLAAVSGVVGAAGSLVPSYAAAAPAKRGPVHDAARRAAVFLDEEVSHDGAYVWSYLPDLSAVWGEMEAKRSMCWIQPPGAPTVGHSLLDAYVATCDRRFYNAAKRTGRALVRAQRPEGGWNYIHDFDGPAALQEWYDTFGINGWRLEEFQHRYDNSTFDDETTATAAQLILRLHLLNPRDRKFAAALDKAINFVTRSQFAGGAGDGGWPQRWPRDPNAITEMPWPDATPPWLPDDARQGMQDGDYTQHVTFNDEVIGENIKFLLMCIVALERHDLADHVHRAMECLRRMQQPAPQPAWGLQHLNGATDGRPDGAIAGGRSYEPRAFTTHTTAGNLGQLFLFFQLTGDRSYLDGVPAALDWLESVELTDEQKADNPLIANRTHPTYIEEGTNRGLFVHRFGSNINNGAYYFDYDHTNTLSHYSAGRNVRTGSLRAQYQRLMRLSDAEVADLVERSPLTLGDSYDLPPYFSLDRIGVLDLQRDADHTVNPPRQDEVDQVIADLGEKNYWLSPADAVTNPYQGPGPTDPYDGRAYMSKHVGDVYDTSPYPASNPPEVPPYEPTDPPMVINTENFVDNMAVLIRHLAQ